MSENPQTAKIKKNQKKAKGRRLRAAAKGERQVITANIRIEAPDYIGLIECEEIAEEVFATSSEIILVRQDHCLVIQR